MPNIYEPQWDEKRDHPGFCERRAYLGKQAGAQRIGASVWELKAGEAAYPYHFHYGDEELIIVLSGTPSLRTPEGWRELEAGEVVAFPIGEESAHQLLNRAEETVRFLAISTKDPLDIVRYPDDPAKVSALYKRNEPDEFRGIYREGAEIDYWDGVEAPE
jgi:uncharacterized cupin superfamily protein